VRKTLGKTLGVNIFQSDSLRAVESTQVTHL